MNKAMLLLAAMSAGLPLAALGAEPCRPGPMPTPESAVGWASGDWPGGEAIRFSARPAFRGRAYVVQVSRAAAGGDAAVRLASLVRERACNRWSREQEWSFPIGAGEADLFFERVGEIEARWQPADRGPHGEIVLVMDGTGFDYAHRRDGVVRRLQLSPDARGESGRLSDLILSLLSIARGEIPRSPGWDD